MTQTTSAAAVPAILAHVIALLNDARPAFRQRRTHLRALALVWGMRWSLARHTITQHLLVLGLTDTDWTAAYRLFSCPHIDVACLQRCVIARTLVHVPADHPYFVADDATSIPRTSRRMPGVGWRRAPNTAPWRRGLSLAQRFGVLFWLPPLEQGSTRAIPI